MGDTTRPTVTVDAGDLEMLIFACGAIKDIENALNTANRDPWVIRGKSDLTAVKERLEAVARRAKRKRDGYPGAEPKAPTASEVMTLERIAIATQGDDRIGASVSNQFFGYDQCEALHRKGLAEIGSYREMVLWGDSQEIGSRDAPLLMRVRLTRAGKEYVEKEAKS